MVTLCSTGKDCRVTKMEFKQKGQISIFFSSTIIVMITFMAFIINIGMFVKAKINLQNATDAAAYAGASVQARQLTNIAYMNWEMRNVYKEWMFKYYVLGSLNLQGVVNPGSNQSTFFNMSSFDRVTTSASGIAGRAIDQYNFPSTCVDFASTGGVGLCTKYLVPGLPRFESSNVLGMDETTNAFVDAIVAEKSGNCSERSKLNFLTSNVWAYNVLTNNPALISLKDEAPEVAADRMGAFPQAFEIAARIRNLEAQVNFPPISGACINPGFGVNCSTSINELTGPAQERTLKALQTGWRNLGVHGTSTTEVPGNRVMKDSFTIKELSPTVDNNLKTQLNLSTLLIPEGSQAREKFYLDLQLMVLNYTVLYTAFTPSSSKGGDGQLETSIGNVAAEGQCSATKVGLPVPGYPLGYVKNPNIMTYYAIESKAKFVGLFNPFSSDITLTAYAAAKPFGGRVGPMLFDVSDGETLKSRSNGLSAIYISGLGIDRFKDTFGNIVNSGQYAPGMPIPINIDNSAGRYWLKNAADPVGGKASNSGLFFGIPNLLYDYPDNNFNNNNFYKAASSALVQEINFSNPETAGDAPQAGLYNKDIFAKFKANLRNLGGTVSTKDIDDALDMVRAPTLYEAHNYLIPTPENLNAEIKTDSWGAITGEQILPVIQDSNARPYARYNMQIYAPIFSSDPSIAIYTGPDDLADQLDIYLSTQEPAIEKYKNSMNIVAATIFKGNVSGATGENTGRDAAVEISDLTAQQYEQISIGPQSSSNALPSCASIAGKFTHFYLGSLTSLVDRSSANPCPTSLRELMQARWADGQLTGDLYQEYRYTVPTNLKEQLFSAYRPGPEHDAGQSNGVQSNALSGRSDTMIRNFYSTKFIPMKSLTESGDSGYRVGTMPIYSEGETSESNTASEAKRTRFSNTLNDTALGRTLEDLHH